MTMDSNPTQNLAVIRFLAIDAFGSVSAAESWLNQYHALLEAAPIVVAESPSGFVEVQKMLSAISYGGVA